MSYCRWSSDDWRCDLYCYEDCSGGWTTHVAGMKYRDVPRITADIFAEPEEWWRQHKVQSDSLNEEDMQPIGLAHDGDTFNDPTIEAFKARLLMLRDAGYSFPDYVLEEVDEEIACAALYRGDGESNIGRES